MNLKYRNSRNAEATARFWNKSLDKSGWYEIKNVTDEEAEILIYDYIGWPFNDPAELIRSLAEMKQKTVTVRINSPGGDVFDGMAIFNALQSHGSKVITRIESLAASAASFIALAGKEVQAYKNAMMMIHEPYVLAVGNQHDLRETAEILEKINNNMIDIYAANATPGKKEIAQMLKAETWFTAKEAKEKGFVDTILDGKGAKATFDLSVFANVPEGMEGNREGRELTEREIERALRDAGASRSFAKAVAVRRSGGTEGDQRDVESLKSSINAMISTFKGGN